MLIHRVCVAFERDHRVVVTEDVGERPHVHTALKCACRKGVPERMEAAVRDFQAFEQSLKTELIRTERKHFVPVADYEYGRICRGIGIVRTEESVFGVPVILSNPPPGFVVS